MGMIRYRQDFTKEDMTFIDNGNGVKIPICPDCIKYKFKYNFGSAEDGYYHCKNLYKSGAVNMSQCHMVFKESDIVGWLYGGDDNDKVPLIISDKAKQELEEIHKQVDKDFGWFFKSIDEYLAKCEGNYTHKDVCGFGKYMYVVNEKGEKLYLNVK